MNIANLLEMENDEKITAMIPVRDIEDGKFLMMATMSGVIKKTSIMEYENVRRGGKIAINLDDGDSLIKVELTDGSQDILIATRLGKIIRFKESDVRSVGRVSRGVKSITLGKDDRVISMSIVGRDDPDAQSGDSAETAVPQILTVSENGYGKKTNLGEYRLQSRGGMGTKSYRITDETGNIAGVEVMTDGEDIMLITSDGTIIRMPGSGVSTISRVTKGVRLMRLGEDVKVVSIAKVAEETEDEDVVEGAEESTEQTEDTPE